MGGRHLHLSPNHPDKWRFSVRHSLILIASVLTLFGSISAMGDSVDDTFLQIVDRLQKQLPMKMEDNTTLVSVSYKDHTMTYDYRVPDDAKADTLQKESLIRMTCDSEDMRPVLDMFAITFIYNYKNEKDNSQVSFSIASADCK